MLRVLNKAAVWAIKGYRKYLSPLKGYSCAHGVLTQGSTCSAVGLKAFRRAGFFQGFALLQRQFDRCTLAAYELTKARESEAPAEPYVRLRPFGPKTQRGMVDCDCPSGSCDMPSGDCGDTPDCCSGSATSCSDMPNCRKGLGLDICDLADCCDFDICGDRRPATRAAALKNRAHKAGARAAERQTQREHRRAAENEAPDEPAERGTGATK